MNEAQVLKHLRRIGSERPLKRLNLRLSCLFEDYDVWFGATALQALADWHHLTDLSLWTCQLPDNFLDTLATSGLGVRLTKLVFSPLFCYSVSLLFLHHFACSDMGISQFVLFFSFLVR